MHVPFNDLKRAAAADRALLREALERVVDSGWFILGDEVRRFEASFADYVGVQHAVAVGNGTDALELALRALDLGPGAEVVTAANAGAYASTAIRRAGAVPGFADVDDRTMNLSAASVSPWLGPAVRAVVVPHLFGRLAEIDALVDLCVERGIPLVEDCAQAHGAAHAGRRAGSFGRLGCFSFYPTKNLGALGDAGALVTDDAALDTRLRALRQYGWQAKYDVGIAGGTNSRMDELQAAVLNARLPQLDARNGRRKLVASAYDGGIRHPQIALPPVSGNDCVDHLYVIRSQARNALKRHLAERGIATDIHYPVPDHRQRAYAGERPVRSLPVTERLAAEVLSLPCYPELSDVEIEAVIAACNAWTGAPC